MCIHDIIFLFIESNKLMNNLQIANDNFKLYYCIKLYSGNLYIEYKLICDINIFVHLPNVKHIQIFSK